MLVPRQIHLSERTFDMVKDRFPQAERAVSSTGRVSYFILAGVEGQALD